MKLLREMETETETGVEFRMSESAKVIRIPHTKIVATLGPASIDLVGELIEAGMSVARINLSHGDPEELRDLIASVRAESKARQSAVAVLCDLPGPKMRLGRFSGGTRDLLIDEVYVLREGSEEAIEGEIYLDCKGVLDAMRSGDRVLLADGAAELIVTGLVEGGVKTKVSRSGQIADRKGIHMPDSDISYELPTARDRECIEFAKEVGADLLDLDAHLVANMLRHPGPAPPLHPRDIRLRQTRHSTSVTAIRCDVDWNPPGVRVGPDQQYRRVVAE